MTCGRQFVVLHSIASSLLPWLYKVASDMVLTSQEINYARFRTCFDLGLHNGEATNLADNPYKIGQVASHRTIVSIWPLRKSNLIKE